MELYTPFQLFTEEECANLIRLAKQSEEANGRAGSGFNPGVRNNKVYWIEHQGAQAMIEQYMHNLLEDYPVTWIQEPIQVSKYNTGEFYHWHKDQINNRRTSARLLTLTCTLQPAPGALFETRDHTFELATGQAVIIPSTVDHRALPPISDTRWALTVWAMGPNPNLEE